MVQVLVIPPRVKKGSLISWLCTGCCSEIFVNEREVVQLWQEPRLASLCRECHEQLLLQGTLA